MAKKVVRERVLKFEEMAQIWKASFKLGDYGTIVRLALYTGQRRGELGGMAWSELDLDQAMWVIPARRVKKDRDHKVPLSPQVVAILENTPRKPGRDFLFGRSKRVGFNSWSQPKRTLDAMIGAGSWDEEWRFHDLRRTFATEVAELGYSGELIELMVNHRSGTRGGIAGVYNRSTWLPQRVEALQHWADYLETRMSGGNVVDLSDAETFAWPPTI